MDKIDVFIPASVSKGTSLKEVEEISNNYLELQEMAGVDNKAFIEFHGKPMIYYIIDALEKSNSVKSVTILGQTEETLPVEMSVPVYYAEGGDSTFDTLMKAIDFYNTWDEVPKYVLNVSSDVPLIQPSMIDRIVETIDEDSDREFFWNLIIAEDIERLYPEISKVPFKLKEANFRFGDLHIFSPSVIKGREETLEKIMGNRKSVWSAIKLISISGIIRYLIGRLRADDIRVRAEKQFDLRAAMMITEFPEPCIDLDYAKDVVNFKKWLGREPRELAPNEDVVILENSTELNAYLETRNYKKGKIPEL